MSENHRKSLIASNLGEFLKHEACSQTELPDRSVLIGQKLLENATILNYNAIFRVDKKSLKMPNMDSFGDFLKT